MIPPLDQVGSSGFFLIILAFCLLAYNLEVLADKWAWSTQ